MERQRMLGTFTRLSFFLFAVVLLSRAANQGALAQSHQIEAQRVRTVAQVLASTYDPGTGLFQGTGWWNSANGMTALVNVSRDLRTGEFQHLFENTFQVAQQKSPGFLNEFYDDEGWWALAWLDVFELQGDQRYLNAAQLIFTDMTGGWSDSCGGGIWWKKNEHYKNAIANELFLSVAVRLAEHSAGADRTRYLGWAQREERWFLASGMINDESLVNDGLNDSCNNNGKTTWSYNQGVLIAGLAKLNRLTGDAVALQTANEIAHAVRLHLADRKGILHDPCEPDCGADGVQFKGILMRNLVTLIKDSPSPHLASLVRNNANNVWNHARTGDNRFSVNWSGPPQDSGTGSLISALDALTAPLSLDQRTTPKP